MTPEFAKAVDPVLVHVLKLLDRVEALAFVDANDERAQIRGYLDRAEGALGDSKDWKLTKYALVSWIDEMLIDSEWSGQSEWTERPLEREFFGGRNAATEFFKKAEDAATLRNKNALEVYYLCVVLGFQGVYGKAELKSFLQEGLPADIATWARKTGRAIQLGQGRPPIAEAPRVAVGAYALEGKYLFVGTWLAAAGLAGLTAILAWALLLQGAS